MQQGTTLHVLEEPAISETLGAALASDAPEAPALEPSERLFAQGHDCQASRYAGVFPILMVLISEWRWSPPLVAMFSTGWRLLMVFALMAVRNICSLGQLKHARRDEVGCVLVFGKLPSVDTPWGWSNQVDKAGRTGALLASSFDDQRERGLAGSQFWYANRQLLPYTGDAKVHAAYHDHPGFALGDSDQQDIANPEIKTLEKDIAKTAISLTCCMRSCTVTAACATTANGSWCIWSRCGSLRAATPGSSSAANSLASGRRSQAASGCASKLATLRFDVIAWRHGTVQKMGRG